MPDLASQIETLYRVIGQLPPQRHPGGQPVPLSPKPAATPHTGSSLQAGRGASLRWICGFYCLWFSLPLSVWFSSGWIGLLFYWRALSGVARLLEKLNRKPFFARKGVELREGGARCPAIELEVP
jgi:hypothetical protein